MTDKVKMSPMERINELEQSLERAKEGLAREIVERDAANTRYENMRVRAMKAESENGDLKRKVDSLEDSYRALSTEYHKASSANAVLRDVLDRLLPKTEKVES